MDLSGTIGLRHEGRLIEAGAKKEDVRFQPVHGGAHARFTKHRYIHTGNKTKGGITTSHYFKRSRNGNSRDVQVHADGSYVKMSRTVKGTRRQRGSMNSEGVEIGDLAVKKVAAEGEAKVDHLAEYMRLMKESGAHQRAADALTQSHQDEDRPLYEQHAGKAWRLGNKAMEHFRRLTKEQRAALKDQHWQTSQQPQGFGRKKMQARKED